MNKRKPKTLLVVKNRALGDSIITLGTIQYLKEQLPDTRIIYGVPKWIAPLYENIETAADKIISLDFKAFSHWPGIFKSIKEEQVDDVLELFQSGRTSKFFNVTKAFGGPKYFFHNHHSKKGKVHDQGIIKANIQRDLDAAWTYFGQDSKVPHYLSHTPRISPKQNIEREDLIFLGVVATRQTKMWPLESYIELAKIIQSNRPSTKVQIPLGPADQVIEEELKRIGLPSNTTIEKIPLNKLAAHFNKGSIYIGNDTGIKHICVALGLPTLTLFGPEPPKEWHPYNIEKNPFFYKEPLECRTREAHYCGLNQCDSMICLNGFSPKQVFEKVESII